jgi:hypothetical protein
MTESSFPSSSQGGILPVDGIVGLYTDRALDRGADPRAIASLSRHARLDSQRLPVMRPAYGPETTGVVLSTSGRPISVRRLVVAGLAVLALLPLGAIVAGAAPLSSESGTERTMLAEIELPRIENVANGTIPNLPPVGGVPFATGPATASGGTVTVDGRERQNRVDAQVYTSEESDITIDGERVQSSERSPHPSLPGFPPTVMNR